jgi:hypothetical protein
MTILRFARTPSLGLVHLAALAGGVCLEDPADVARYTRAFAQLRAVALTPVASFALLRELASR